MAPMVSRRAARIFGFGTLPYSGIVASIVSRRQLIYSSSNEGAARGGPPPHG
jgi:hypothetical protein